MDQLLEKFVLLFNFGKILECRNFVYIILLCLTKRVKNIVQMVAIPHENENIVGYTSSTEWKFWSILIGGIVHFFSI